jgi:hypothetical protein
MITFKLEYKAAESVIAVLNATAGHASFLDALNEQFNAQFVPATPVVEVAPVVEEVVVEEVIEEAPAPKKSKAKSEE